MDTPYEPGSDPAMETLVAVLEQIAKATLAGLLRIEARLDRMDNRFDRMDSRLDRLDERRERDFRITFGALITVALGLAALMAHGFKWLP